MANGAPQFIGQSSRGSRGPRNPLLLLLGAAAQAVGSALNRQRQVTQEEERRQQQQQAGSLEGFLNLVGDSPQMARAFAPAFTQQDAPFFVGEGNVETVQRGLQMVEQMMGREAADQIRQQIEGDMFGETREAEGISEVPSAGELVQRSGRLQRQGLLPQSEGIQDRQTGMLASTPPGVQTEAVEEAARRRQRLTQAAETETRIAGMEAEREKAGQLRAEQAARPSLEDELERIRAEERARTLGRMEGEAAGPQPPAGPEEEERVSLTSLFSQAQSVNEEFGNLLGPASILRQADTNKEEFDNGTFDIQLMNLFQRLIDPATVREGDIALQRMGQDRIQDLRAQVLRQVGSGNRIIGDTLRKNLKSAAEELLKARVKDYQNRRQAIANELGDRRSVDEFMPSVVRAFGMEDLVEGNGGFEIISDEPAGEGG